MKKIDKNKHYLRFLHIKKRDFSILKFKKNRISYIIVFMLLLQWFMLTTVIFGRCLPFFVLTEFMSWLDRRNSILILTRLHWQILEGGRLVNHQIQTYDGKRAKLFRETVHLMNLNLFFVNLSDNFNYVQDLHF